MHLSLKRTHSKEKKVIGSPERSLTPFVLVQHGDEACFSCPQDVVTGKVHGSVEVANGQAEPQHAVRKVNGPLGSLQCLHGVSQTQHCGTPTHISHNPSALVPGKELKLAASLTLSCQAHVCLQLTDGFVKFSRCPTLLQSVTQQSAGILGSPVSAEHTCSLS